MAARHRLNCSYRTGRRWIVEQNPEPTSAKCKDSHGIHSRPEIFRDLVHDRAGIAAQKLCADLSAGFLRRRPTARGRAVETARGAFLSWLARTVSLSFVASAAARAIGATQPGRSCHGMLFLFHLTLSRLQQSGYPWASIPHRSRLYRYLSSTA